MKIKEMKNKLEYIWLYTIYGIEVLYTKILYLFKIQKSIDPIPKGHYCYIPDEEKNNNLADDEKFDGFYIKTCKYYRSLPKGLHSGCVFIGYIGFEPLLGDQCKICGIKDEYEEYIDEDLDIHN